MREFLQRAHGPDVQCVEEDSVVRIKHWSQSPLSVVISLHVILCFTDCRFGFVNRCPHPLHELIDCL